MSDSIIRAEGLTKTFGKNVAVNDFTINITGEKMIGLIGRNGAGKTTLMKMIAGQHEINKGKLEVFGSSPMDNLSVLENIVYTYHDMGYLKGLRLKTIIDNYALMFPDFDSAFAERLLAYFNLSLKSKFKNLSQGMASIFNFICGLACRAKLTMLDEPVLGMDVTIRKAAYEVLLREYSQHPRTIIISSHLLSEIEAVLSDIILIDRGRLVFYDNIDDLRQSAYRVEGKEEDIDSFVMGKSVIFRKKGLSAEAVVHEALTEDTATLAKKKGLILSSVRAEDLYVYLTGENKEGELECLWK